MATTIPVSENTVGPSGLVRMYIQNANSYFAVSPHEYYTTVTTFGSYGTGASNLNYPWGAAITPDGSEIWICDGSNHRVARFTLGGTWVGSFGSYGAGTGSFNTPRDIAFDPSGNAYVADSLNGRIQKFNSSGVYQSNWSVAGGYYPSSIIYDSYNSWLWIGSNSVVRAYTTAGATVNTFSISTYQPMSVAVAPTGDRVYIGSQSGNILVYNTSGTFQGALYTGNLTIGAFNFVDVDKSDILWVCDWYSDTILKGVPSNAIISTLMRSGSTGDMSCQDPVSTCRYGEYVFVIDQGNHKVHKLTSGSLSNGFCFKVKNSGDIQHTGSLIYTGS